MNELYAIARDLILALRASGDTHAADLISDNLDDPSALASLMSVDPETYAEWTTYTNPDTKQTGWISDGGQVRYERPNGPGDQVHDDATSRPEKPDGTHLVEGLQNEVPELKNPTVWGKIKGKLRDAAAVAQRVYLESAIVLHKAANILPDIFDHPDDMKNKFGYQPGGMLAGAGDHVAQPDAFRDQFGISAWTAATIVNKIVERAIAYGKKKMSGTPQPPLPKFADSDGGDVAEALGNLWSSVAGAMGLPIPGGVVAGFRAMIAERSAKPTAMADDSAHVGGAVADASGEPASDEVALAGRDGKVLARLIRKAKAEGVRRFAEIVGQAVAGYNGSGPLLSRVQSVELAGVLSAVNSTAELLGRLRVREIADRAAKGGAHRFADDVPLSTAGINPLTAIRTPEEALAYFLGLNPKIGVDPERFANEQRRRAFTLARSANEVLTQKVQEAIGKAMAEHKGTADATADVAKLLDDAGVSTGNPQYSEMVFRTNAMDSYQTGAYEEGLTDDVADVFPCWEYLIVDDERTGADHRPHANKLYPASVPFAKVRGHRSMNCRCSLRWVDKYELADRQSAGERVEEKW